MNPYELSTPMVQRQLALSAALITFYHKEVNKERAFLKACRRASEESGDEFAIHEALTNMRFYRILLRKYVPLQVALKNVIKSRKKPSSTFPRVCDTAPINLH